MNCRLITTTLAVVAVAVGATPPLGFLSAEGDGDMPKDSVVDPVASGREMHHWRDEDLKSKHGWASWAGRVKGREAGFHAGFRLLSDLVPRWTCVSDVDFTAEGYRGQQLRLVPKPNPDNEVLFITVLEFDSVRAAHEGIIDYLGSLSAGGLPRGESMGMRFGDVVFGCYGEVPCATLFARNNLMIWISGQRPILDLAEKIDALLTARPRQTPAKVADRLKIAKFQPSRREVQAGTRLPLHISVPEQEGKPLEYRLFCTGGQISRENGTYYFEAQTPGKHKVELYVIDEAGLVTGAERTVEVSQ